MAVSAGCRCFQFDREGAVPTEVAECRRCSHLALAALEQGDASAAEAHARAAVKSCSRDAGARRHLAEALWRQGKTEAAFEQIEAARLLAPEDSLILVQEGKMRLALDHWEAARAAAEAAIDADPQSHCAWMLRGDTYRRAKRYDEALADYARALGLRPGDPAVVHRLALVSLARDQPFRALAYAESLIDGYDPDEVPRETLELYGQALAASGRRDAAATAFAAARQPSKPRAESRADRLAEGGGSFHAVRGQGDPVAVE